MLLDYELAISCALAALAILRIVHLRRKWHRVCERRRTIESNGDAPRGSSASRQTDPQDVDDLRNEDTGLFDDRLIMLLLILALLWFGGRIWMAA